MRFVDSHVHITDYDNPDSLIRYATATEGLLVSAAIDEESSIRSLLLGARFRGVVRPFVGVHPSAADRELSLDWLKQAALTAAGLGEVGLDPRYSDISEPSPQMRTLLVQLELAERLGKAVQVHSRGAEAACIEKLTSHRLTKVLLHWFEGEELIAAAAEKGYYVSFGPALLYSKKLSRMATTYPEDLILAESDGPVSFSALGGASGPHLIPSVVFRLAELRRRAFEDMTEILFRNALVYLGTGRKVNHHTKKGLK